MRSTSCLQNVPAPSPSLLRFLKSQSEVTCFFDQSPIASNSARPRISPPCRRPAATSLRCSSSAPIGANLLHLDFLLPRASSAKRNALRSRNPPGLSSKSNFAVGGIRGIRQNSIEQKGFKAWFRKLCWGSSYSQRARSKERVPHDSFPEAEMFSHGRSVLSKAVKEPRLRCTELDEAGKEVLASGDFKKTELIQRYGLLPRDLRKIDSSILPHILVRPSAILINLLHLRVLIKANRVLIFDAYGSTDSYAQSAFKRDLEIKLRQPQNSTSAGGLPYEFRALEAVLMSVTTGLETEFDTVRAPVTRVLQELEEDIDREKLRHLLIYSKRLSTFEQKAKLVRDAIDELLEADDDLAAMYLTEKSHDLIRGEDDHTEVEMLLESYHKVCDEIVQAAGNLVSNIRNTEEIVKAILDANRNSLMLLDLKFSIGTLAIGSGGLIAAFFGMNLKTLIEESDYGFVGVTGVSIGLAFWVGWACLKQLRIVQRVSMSAEAGLTTRGMAARSAWRLCEEEGGKVEVRRK